MSDSEVLQLLLRLPEEERRRAIYDEENGLYAPWYFDLRVHEEIARADRYGELFLLLLIEPGGHRFSQADGQRITEHMRRGLRQTDLVTHLGGFRFAVLLPHAGEAAGSIVADRLQESLAPTHVRVSTAWYPGDGDDLESLVRTAQSRAWVSNGEPGPDATTILPA